MIDFSNFNAPPKSFKFNENILQDPIYRAHLDTLINTEVSKSVIYTGNKTYFEAPKHIHDTFIQRTNALNSHTLK